MKSILYAGAALMISASVYGFVNYKQTHNKKEFKQMYAEDKKTVAPVVVDENETDANDVKTAVSNETGENKKEIAATNDKKTKTVKKVVVKKKKKRLDASLFSRAPLREEEFVVPPIKADEKIEKKEQ